jgi:hypothetical protein
MIQEFRMTTHTGQDILLQNVINDIIEVVNKLESEPKKAATPCPRCGAHEIGINHEPNCDYKKPAEQLTFVQPDYVKVQQILHPQWVITGNDNCRDGRPWVMDGADGRTFPLEPFNETTAIAALEEYCDKIANRVQPFINRHKDGKDINWWIRFDDDYVSVDCWDRSIVRTIEKSIIAHKNRKKT